MIELKTLGRQVIRSDGRELQGIAGHKQKFALLTYIALEGPLSRDHLLTVFWPDREEARARHSLSQALYAIRREVGSDVLRVEGDSIFTEKIQADVERLERAAEARDWETVVSLYDGPFLDQFSLGGAFQFEEWQTTTRSRLARTAQRAFPQLIEHQMREKELRKALATAASWVRLDPLQDEAQHIFITLLAQSGQRAAALEQFEVYRERLQKELEVEPLEGTVALIERIRAGAIPEYRPLRAPSASKPPPAPMRDEREAEAASPTSPPSQRTLWEQLWTRRVPQVGIIYLLIVWLGTHLASEAVYWELLPSWGLPATVFVLVLGLPLVLLVAWAHGDPDGGFGPGIRFWPRWAERIEGGQVAWFLTGLALLLAVLLAGLGGERQLQTPLRNRVLIFPFEVPPERNPLEGEDMATWIGATLEETAGIGWIDGWYRLSGTEVRTRQARSTAISLGAGFWLRGRIAFRNDSVFINAELHDVAGDSILAHPHESGRLDPGGSWIRREAADVVADLLPPLAEATDVQEPQQFTLPSDTPAAADSFLAAERSYRRLQHGEALRRYQAALAADSTFGIAALKGAMAAGWLRESQEAQRLVELAMRRTAFLEPSRAEFGRGLQHYWGGRGDSAVVRFRRAAELAPDFIEAQVQLGETYYHLPTSDAPADSLTREAFLEVRSRNPEFYPVLYHLIEIAAREGDIESGEAWMQAFLRLEPDTVMIRHAASIMYDCVRRAPEVIDWARHLRDHPAAVYQAARGLAVGGAHSQCARAAWRRILDSGDTAQAIQQLRFGALLGVASLLAAENRAQDLLELQAQEMDSHPGLARRLADVMILAHLAGTDGLEARAAERARELRTKIAGGLRHGYYLWLVGRWEASSDDLTRAEALVDSLLNRLDSEAVTATDSGMARSLDAHVSLAGGDTGRALELFEELVPPWKDQVAGRGMWPFESRPGDVVTLAELLDARGEYARAVTVAAGLDSPARPPSDLIFLPRSLLVRLRAGRALGDAKLEARMRERLADLGRTDLIDRAGQDVIEDVER